jgi:hypothetical protein
MKSTLAFILALVIPLVASTQEKPKKKDVSEKPTEKKSLPKKVYKSWVQVNQKEENQSLSGKVLNTFAKILKPATPKEE